MVIHVYSEVGGGNSIQTLKSLSKTKFKGTVHPLFSCTRMFIFAQSAWVGSLHSNIV